MTNNPTDWMAAYQAEQQKRQAQLSPLKDVLLHELASAGIVTVTVEYDGEGHSGQIESIAVEDASQNRVEIADNERWDKLDNQITEFVWEVLGAHHDGFENNDGGFGEITIDVMKGTVQLDHNTRVTDTFMTSTEV